MLLPFKSSYPITQPFGANPQDYAKFGMKGHNGIDYGLPPGTPVIAAHRGVAYSLYEVGGFGNYVQIVGDKYKTIYAHLQKVTIVNGAPVAEGQVIGLSGNTGNSSGPHLHFGLKPIPQDNNNGYFGAIDPQPILNVGGNMPSSQTIVDALTIQLLYNNGLLRQPSDAEVKARAGQTVEQVARDILGSAEHKQLQSDAVNGMKARLEDWEGQIASLKEQLAQQGTELKPGKYYVS